MRTTWLSIVAAAFLAGCATQPAQQPADEPGARMNEGRVTDLEARLARSEQDFDAARERVMDLERQYVVANNELAAAEAAQAAQQRDVERLREENARLARDLQEKGTDLQKEISRLNALKLEAEGMVRLLEQERASLLASVENERQRLLAAADTLRKQLSDEIGRGEIEVRQIEGVLIVSLSDAVLFLPDSAQLNPRYEPVLRRVVEVFNRLPDKVIRVEGHTAVAVSSPETLKRFPTSWDLGAGRAVAVVRFLQEKAGVDPLRLLAVSFGEYRPTATNTTDAGKQRNRRVEIVLTSRPLYQYRELQEAGMTLP